MVNKLNKSSSGKRGDQIRSDCYIELEIKRSGGIKIEMKSKVESMYGDSIKAQLTEMCKHFNISHAEIIN